MQTGRTSRLGRAVWIVTAALVAIGVAVALRRAIQLVPIALNGYTPPGPAPANPIAAQFASTDDVFARYPILTLAHILPALVFLLLGPFQFVTRIRNRYPGWHRAAGRVYLASGAVVGITALAMSLSMPAIGGTLQAAATTVFSIWLLFALGNGLWHILRRQVARHRRWMLRAFATGLAVATIRPIVALFAATSLLSGMQPRAYFGIAFWIGFLLHVAIAEAWLGRSRITRPMSESARA